jgi:transcriptional regulator with XRE-family HTH domain
MVSPARTKLGARSLAPGPGGAVTRSLALRRPVRDRPIDKHVGERLRAIRERKGLSLEELGTQVGITADQLAAHEAGERIRPELLYAIARTLNVLIASFFTVEATEPPRPRDELDELAEFPLFETARLLEVWRQLDEAAQRKALQVVRMIAGE